MLETADVQLIEAFIPMTITNIHREYPNQIALRMTSDADLAPPRALTPVFYGCYDWHSAVHSHWQLIRAIRLMPEAVFVPDAIAALNQSLTEKNVSQEVAYLTARPGFERPYGLAWLLQLTAKLWEWNTNQAELWLDLLAPLEEVAVEHLLVWLPKLTKPVRSGYHNQTAFSLGLIFDWSITVGATKVTQLIGDAAERFYAADAHWPLHYEPSGTDFLSPGLAEADLMRRLMKRSEFAHWLTTFLPQIQTDGRGDWLPTGVVSDKSDGRLAHLAGLNVSRAWMLEGIAHRLPREDARIAGLRAAADIHRSAGLAFAADDEYMLSHWLPSFALYLLTRRGSS